MTQHKVVNAGWRRIERLSSDPDHAGLNVTPPDPDQAGLNAKGLIGLIFVDSQDLLS